MSTEQIRALRQALAEWVAAAYGDVEGDDPEHDAGYVLASEVADLLGLTIDFDAAVVRQPGGEAVRP
jgi:hypothetical protein